MQKDGNQRKTPVTSSTDAFAASGVLLRTKLLIPLLPFNVMAREKLAPFPDRIGSARVTCVVAPSGYGKTMAAANWAKYIKASKHRVAWLTLDAEDDDPDRYLRYLIAAVKNAIPALQIPHAITASLMPQRALLSLLINVLAEFDEALFLFIDNYNLITHPQIIDAMIYLLQHGPQALHLVLIGTGEPRLPLGLLRASRAVLDIDAEKLRFDLEETRRYVEREKLLDFGPTEVGALQQKTGGWIAALSIACHNLRESEDPRASLRTLSGGSRHIGTYLGELLNGIPESLLNMMLRTSILDRFCAPLCNVIADVENSESLLHMLALRYQLIAAIDDEMNWFRFHPLVAEYLRQRLESDLPGQAPDLHRLAATWHAEQRMWTEAIAHAINAGDQEQALNWIEKTTVESLYRGELLTIMGWHRRFPNAALHFRPEVQVSIALTHLMTARQKEAEGMLVEIERHVDNYPAEFRSHLRWQCQVLRASVAAVCRDDTVLALELALECLKDDCRDSWMADAVVNTARFCYAKQGNLLGFHALPWHSGSDQNDPRFVFTMIYRLCFLGMTNASQLHYHAAEHNFREACSIARKHQGAQAVTLVIPLTFLAEILYEQDRVDEAEALLSPHLELIHASCPLDVVLSAQLLTSRIALLRGNIEQAYAALEQGENIGHVHSWGRLRACMLAERLRIVLEEGRLMEGSACLAQLRLIAAAHPVTTRCAWSQIHDYLALSSALLYGRQGETSVAIEGLSLLADAARREQQPLLLIRAKTALAIARIAAGDSAQAVADFSEVLTLGSQTGVCRSIADIGPELEPLLLEVNSRGGEHAAYVDKLFAAWRRLYKSTTASTDTTPESLSPRERNVLELVAAGQSNKHIAKALGIAPETVKTHLKNVFVKLNVSSRTQAIARLNTLYE